jgi:hypothetical protein
MAPLSTSHHMMMRAMMGMPTETILTLIAEDSAFVPRRCAAFLKHTKQVVESELCEMHDRLPRLLEHTLAMLNIEPPEPKNSGSNADDPIYLAHLLGMLHIVDLIC